MTTRNVHHHSIIAFIMASEAGGVANDPESRVPSSKISRNANEPARLPLDYRACTVAGLASRSGRIRIDRRQPSGCDTW